MIKIEINAEPSQLEWHLRALGYIRAPIGVGEKTESPLTAVAIAQFRHEAETLPAVRYFYHPESNSLFTTLDDIRPIGDGLVEELSKERFDEIAIRQSEEANQQTADYVHGANPLADELAALERPEDFKAPGQPARQPGQPAPGRRRRTREEIAEDQNLAYLRNADFNPARGISTGEERIDPEAAAQDAADEAAETAERATDKPTLDDLRAAALRYQEKFGVKAAVDNMRVIIGCAIAEVKPEGVADAISRVEAAINGSTVMGVPNGKAVEPEAPATGNKGDVVLAVTAYGKKFDGTGDPAHMIFTREDMPKLFQKLFGEAAISIGTIPQTPESFGKAVAAINAAVHDNPFQREARQ
jgi:hypothetical protein